MGHFNYGREAAAFLNSATGINTINYGNYGREAAAFFEFGNWNQLISHNWVTGNYDREATAFMNLASINYGSLLKNWDQRPADDFLNSATGINKFWFSFGKLGTNAAKRPLS